MNLRAMHYFSFPSKLNASICLGQGHLLYYLIYRKDLTTAHRTAAVAEKGDRGETML